MTNWIKLSEKLPPSAGRYLAYPDPLEDIHSTVAWYDKGKNHWEDLLYLEGYNEFTPTHWAVMPEVPV